MDILLLHLVEKNRIIEDNNNFFMVISFCEIIGNEEGNAQENLFLFRLKDYYLNLNFDMIFAFP